MLFRRELVSQQTVTTGKPKVQYKKADKTTSERNGCTGCRRLRTLYGTTGECMSNHAEATKTPIPATIFNSRELAMTGLYELMKIGGGFES